jgi:hypothetical protein
MSPSAIASVGTPTPTSEQTGSPTPPYINPQSFSFTTGLVSVPIFSITMLTVSPAFM